MLFRPLLLTCAVCDVDALTIGCHVATPRHARAAPAMNQCLYGWPLPKKLGDGTKVFADGSKVLPDGTKVMVNGGKLMPDGSVVLVDGTVTPALSQMAAAFKKFVDAVKVKVETDGTKCARQSN